LTFEKVNLNWKDYVKTSEKYKRPVATGNLVADTRKLEKKLGIKPKIMIDDLISIMLENDLNSLK
jgi:GDP-D-mannose dehydratase